MYRVVLADDEPEFRTWLRSILELSKEFNVVGEAGSGAEAIHMVNALLPDVIIADIYMPDPDGLEVVRFVQRHCPSTKAILISAQEEQVYEIMAKREGALAFIPKTKVSIDTLTHFLAVQK